MRINGLGFQGQTEPPSSDLVATAYRPYVETRIEAFRTSRSMFERNFPVDKASYSYAVFWNACKLLASGASDAEKADLFAGTATLFYRLNDILCLCSVVILLAESGSPPSAWQQRDPRL